MKSRTPYAGAWQGKPLLRLMGSNHDQNEADRM